MAKKKKIKYLTDGQGRQVLGVAKKRKGGEK